MKIFRKEKGSLQYGLFTIVFIMLLVMISLVSLYARQVKSVKYRYDNSVVLSALYANLIDLSINSRYECQFYQTENSSVKYGNIDEFGVSDTFNNACFSAYTNCRKKFTEALITNLNLVEVDGVLSSASNADIKKVEVKDFVVYNVFEEDVYCIRNNEIIRYKNQRNILQTPAQNTISSSTIYVDVEVTMKNKLTNSDIVFSLKESVDNNDSF